MKHSILVFGALTDITEKEQIEVENIENSEQLMARLVEMYPAIAHHKFAIAIDNHIINEVKEIKADSSIALLPPFSGG